MIVKKIKSKKCSKSKARQITDLVDYIRQPKGARAPKKSSIPEAAIFSLRDMRASAWR